MIFESGGEDLCGFINRPMLPLGNEDLNPQFDKSD
jgi:hypothetical protein